MGINVIIAGQLSQDRQLSTLVPFNKFYSQSEHTTQTIVAVINLGVNNGSTNLLLLVRHRIEAIGTLFGGSLLDPVMLLTRTV
jgi:hypothetical protein